MAVDKWDTKQAVIDFDEQHGVEFPSIYGGEGGGGYGIFNDWGILGTPTVVIIHPDRTVLKNIIWPPDEETIIAEVESFGGEQKECTESIFDFTAQSINMNLYPNPATDYCNLSFAIDGYKNFEVKIADMLGSISRTYNYESKGTASKDYNVPLEGLDSGIYFLTVEVEGSLVGTQKLIVK